MTGAGAKSKVGKYRVDADVPPRPNRPPCWTRGGCCMHTSAIDLARALAAAHGSVTVAELAQAQHCRYRVASSRLSKAVVSGKLVRIARGRYALPEKNRGAA